MSIGKRNYIANKAHHAIIYSHDLDDKVIEEFYLNQDDGSIINEAGQVLGFEFIQIPRPAGCLKIPYN